MKTAALKEPVFESDFFFRAIFYRDPRYALKRAKKLPVEKTVEKTVEKIFVIIKANPSITQKEIMDKTGLTRRGVEWNLKKLKGADRIQRIGPDKGGHWEIIEK